MSKKPKFTSVSVSGLLVVVGMEPEMEVGGAGVAGVAEGAAQGLELLE